MEAARAQRMPRSPVRVPVTWRVRDGVHVLMDDGELRDVNAAGAFLHLFCTSTHPMWPGTRIKLELHSQSGEISTSGRVRWVGLHSGYHGLPGVGIEFDEPEPQLAPPPAAS